MKREILLLIFALIISGGVFAQDTNKVEDEFVVFEPYEKRAAFPGGESVLRVFMDENIKNPSKGQGKVVVQFVINEQGKAVEPEVVHSVSPELDSEVIRVVNLMPRWMPAIYYGKPIRFKYTLPVCFNSLGVPKTESLERPVEDVIINISKPVISANFSLKETGKNEYNTSGKFILKNEKFMVETPEMKIWFDGKTMWSYSPQINEVSIIEPDKKELETINPLLLIKTVNETCTRTFIKGNMVIVFTPKVDKVDFEKIELTVGEATNNPARIEVYGKDNSRIIFQMINYKSENNISDNTFVFNKNEYKGVFVKDLR